MSAISSVGRTPHYRIPGSAAPSRTTTSLTSSTLSGSITGSAQALGALQANAGLSGDVIKQIEQAVTSALQSSKPTDDPHKVVQNAILSVLKKNAGANGKGGSDADTTDSDGTHRTFNQTLQAYGISPQQFRAQLLAAVHQTGGGASSISSFPPGTVLDTAA
jgi:hypothetical protein